MRQCAPRASSRPSQCAARLGRAAAITSRAPVRPVPSCRSTAVQVQARAGFEFEEDKFHRVCLVRKAPYGPLKLLPADPNARGPYNGVLVFKQECELLVSDTKVLEVFVAGDTAGNIYTLLNNHQYDRPMVHDLMWTMMSQMSTGNQQWQLLHVAIIALKDDVFIGRLFFGDAKTGEIKWDCDCRPSDGCYLHLKSGCPFYVCQEVWNQASVPVRFSKVHLIAAHEAQLAQEQQQQQQSGGPQSPPSSPQKQQRQQPQQLPQEQQQQAGRQLQTTSNVRPSAERNILAVPTAAEEYTSVRAEDPDAIRLLKRELAIAVSEEDYKAAVRIRDHPYMQLYRRIQTFAHFGRQQEAEDLEAELHGMIRKSNMDASSRD